MADSYGRVAALRPTDANEAELYEVSSGYSLVGTLRICNQTVSQHDFSVAHTDVSGAATSEDWIAYGHPLAGNRTLFFNVELGSGETIRVQTSSGDTISFLLAGQLIDDT